MNPKQGPSISVSCLIVTLLILVLTSIAAAPSGDEVLVVESYVPFEFRALSDLDTITFRAALGAVRRADHILEFYAAPETRALTLAFFERLTGDYLIAERILEECLAAEVPPALAFALAYEESDFDPKAFNKNPSSVDRGLFQLNSSSFPKLSIEDFYDVRTNIRLGVNHLAFCLKQGGNDVAALAVYNAGLGRVSKGGTPRATLDYINRITGNRDRLDALFEAQVVAAYTQSATIAAALSSASGGEHRAD